MSSARPIQPAAAAVVAGHWAQAVAAVPPALFPQLSTVPVQAAAAAAAPCLAVGGGVFPQLSTTSGTPTSGNGAGFGSGGSGGVSDASGAAGGSLNGGNGGDGMIVLPSPSVVAGGSGGAQYQGGGAVGGATGGLSAFANGMLATTTGTASLTLTSAQGNIGSSKAPLEISWSYTGYITGENGYLNLPATGTIYTYLSGIAANVGANAGVTIDNYSDSASNNPMGNLNVMGSTVGQNGGLYFYNYGNTMAVTGPVTGAANSKVYLESSTDNTGDLGTLAVNANVTSLGNNGYLYIYSSGDMTAKANFSAPGGVELYSINSISLTGNATATGPNGGIYLYADDSLTVNGNLTGNSSGNGAVYLYAGFGSLTMKGNATGTGYNGYIYADADGPLTLNGTFQTTGGGNGSYISLTGYGGVNATGTYSATNGYIYISGGDEVTSSL